MASLLESTCNTRAVLPGSLRILRSDAVTAPTERDVAFLLAHDVTTVIDLRSDEECERKPCPLAATEGFTYHRLPVTGGNAMPSSPQEVAPSYIRMVDEQMTRIIRTIDEAPGGVIYFCTAGKDRTGVVSAILQHRAGMPREAIITDYLLTGENQKERLAYFGQLHPEIDPAIYTPRRETMEAFLSWLDRA